jgi:hypothetical protein
LDIHINDDHRDENELAEEITISYECAICKRIFNKRTDFKDHMKDHSKVLILKMLDLAERLHQYHLVQSVILVSFSLSSSKA